MRKILIHLISAARPNFMKIAPLFHALKKREWADPKIIHTGQHYDLNMSDVFFEDLGLPHPDLHLGIGSGSHAEQTGKVLIAYEKVVIETRPDLVIVVGDVNSTMACTLAASKVFYGRNEFINRPIVAHLEAGLRSFDREMPEEINRLVADALADILWTPSPDADEHLRNEGVRADKIVRVGNIMIDSLEMLRDRIERAAIYEEFKVVPKGYGLITFHRPSNVDNLSNLEKLFTLLCEISEKLPLIFPVHPRTKKHLESIGMVQRMGEKSGMKLVEPQSYIRFMNLVFNSRFVITDSGGIQEETSYLNIPCFTMRANTERPVTIINGTNQLCTAENLESRIEDMLSGHIKQGSAIEFWDGSTAERVADSIERYFFKQI